MVLSKRKRLGDLLVEAGAITSQQLDYALQNKSKDEKLGDYLIRENLLTEQQLIEVLEIQLGIPQISISQFVIDPELVHLLPKEIAKRSLIMPLTREKNKLLIAMADPMDYFSIEEVRMATGCQIETAIASKDELNKAISKYYDLQETMDAALNNLVPSETFEEPEMFDDDSPIVKLVNQIISNAVVQRASDIHFDPQETELRIRYRIDGVLRTERSLPRNMQNMIIARIKIMGNLNITENRLPQDGRIKANINLHPVDIRLSTLPTVYGEKVVMRVLDLTNSHGDLQKLGFSSMNLMHFKEVISKPNGIVLITGPTGSGKSSTLSTTLNYLNSEEVNIITVEDPVEYQIEGVNQIQVREEIGLTFATGLRSILRQDPDIIMIGEIRDTETAQIATRASLTGHLVLSTLHTNSAAESISRLFDMGIEPFLLSSSVVGVVAQRLVRRVCRDCGKYENVSPEEKDIFSNHDITISHVKRGSGCPSCNNTGYRGRFAIHELLIVDEKVKELILNRASLTEIKKYMATHGYRTLLEDGLLKVAAGLTTTEEILRVATDE